MRIQDITAAELKRYNANNRGTNTGDCVCRSISMAFAKDYVEVNRDLNAAMKEKHWGSWKSPIVYESVIRKYGAWNYGGEVFQSPNLSPYTGEIFEDYNPRTRLGEWIDTYGPAGVFLVETGSRAPRTDKGRFRHGGDHIVCVIDGVIYDSWDSSTQFVYNYVWIENRPELKLSGIDKELPRLAQDTRKIILDECDKLANKHNLSDGDITIYNAHSNGSFGFDIQVLFAVTRFEETFKFKWELAYMFNPATTVEEAEKKIKQITKVRIYDRFYEINKKLKDKEEGYNLWKESGLTDPYNPWFYDGLEKRFYNSLPGWVKPFITYINVQEPGQYSDSYTLTFRPIPGDPKHDKKVRLEAYESSAIKKMLEWYKKDFSRPWDDYDPHEEF